MINESREAAGTHLAFNSQEMFLHATAFAQPIPALLRKIADHQDATTTSMFKGATSFLKLAFANPNHYFGEGMLYIRDPGKSSMERQLVPSIPSDDLPDAEWDAEWDAEADAEWDAEADAEASAS
jgi:hypothetical protein